MRKHAGADHARLFVHYQRERLTITVEDDGSTRPHHHRPGAGHGLIGMRERAATIGGTLYAGPRAEGGFIVTAELPLHAGCSSLERDRRNGHDDSRAACR
ncbi:ATP-binding protein [Streptomyces sp. NPDC059690]|uniref:ATP-binding protein n=1 Tax=Streptomyces sp. NPDC059690 TaxID=3346907 RepID=UPI00367908BC